MHIALVNQDATMQHLLDVIVKLHGHTSWSGSFDVLQQQTVSFDLFLVEPGYDEQEADRLIVYLLRQYPLSQILLVSSYDESRAIAKQYDLPLFLSPFSVSKLRALLGPSQAKKESVRGPNFNRNAHNRDK